MKRKMLTLSFLLFCFAANAQNSGTIRHSSSLSGKPNSTEYIYISPLNLSLPENLFASIVYKINEEYFFIKKRLKKKTIGHYSFTYSPPDSVKALIISINDSKQRTIDNNRDSGYTILCNKQPKEAAAARIEAAYLLSYYATTALQLDMNVASRKMVLLYEEAYRISPFLKQDLSTYRYYLSLNFQQKGNVLKPGLLAFAKEMEVRNTESSLATALYIYRFLQMDKKRQAIENQSIRKFAKGEIAKQEFVNKFYDKKGKTEQSILNDKDEYVKRFGDTSSQMKYTFYTAIIEWLLVKKKYAAIVEYELKVGEDIGLAYIYNGEAANLMEEYVSDSSAENLTNAQRIILRSMQIIAARKQTYHNDKDDFTLQNATNKFRQTYAQVLFLQGQFDSAFYHQNLVVNNAIEPKSAPASALCLVKYAIKLKNDQFARGLAIEQLDAGNYSPELMEQLKAINERLGINNASDKFASWSTREFATEQKIRAINSRFGSQKFKDFSLIDLSGKTVTLSSFRNKVIILDFWASWCAPCLAAFPHMQEIVKKYQKDSSVVFLFINTAEQSSLQKMKATASKIMRDKEYDFRILLDHQRTAGLAYKVNYIPETFVIDKKGNIVFMGNDSSTIEIEIEYAKK